MRIDQAQFHTLVSFYFPFLVREEKPKSRSWPNASSSLLVSPEACGTYGGPR